jgi:hypothetical protein
VDIQPPAGRRDPMDTARDHLARAAENYHPGWQVGHHLHGWTAVRACDQRTVSCDSLPGLRALITVAGPGAAPRPRPDHR